jgi:peroxiredoxin
MKMLPYAKVLFGSLVLAVTLAAGFASAAGQQGLIRTANTPIVRLQDLDGGFHDIADLKGNVLLLSFGATWCQFCTKELGALEELIAEYRDKPVKFFWISVDNPGMASDKKLKAYAKEHNFSITILRDPTRTAYLQFGKNISLPTMAFFGKDGKFVGPTTVGMARSEDNYKERVRAKLDALLAAAAAGSN